LIYKGNLINYEQERGVLLKPGAMPLESRIIIKARGDAPGYINVAPLGLSWGVASFYLF